MNYEVLTMNEKKLERFYHQHCRFKLQSGREVFGVIWEEENEVNNEVVFSSVKDHDEYFQLKSDSRSELSPQAMRLNKRDIIYVESIS